MARKKKEKTEHIVTTKEISEILSLSTRRVQQLAQENALVKSGHGKFDLPASIEAYVEFRVERAREDEELDKSTEEALWTREKRKKTEMENKIMRGELHRGKDVERVISDMLGAFRARLLSFPSKYAPQVMPKNEIPVIKEILKQGIFEAMDELSEYDPYVFYDQSDDKLMIEEEEDDVPEEEEGSSDHGSKKQN